MSILKKLTQGKIFAGLAEKSPEVLMGSAFGLAVIACFVTHRQTLKADEALRKEKERIAKEKDIPVEEVTMEKAEEFRIVAPYYVGPVLCMAGGGACLYFSAKESQRKLAAATAAYMVSEEKFMALEEKAKDILGLKKEEEAVREEIQKNPPSKENVKVTKAEYLDDDGYTKQSVQFVGAGDYTFYDTLTKQYFVNDVDSVKNAINELNEQLMDELQINLNDYCFAIGAEGVHDDIAYDKVWDVKDGLLKPELKPILEDGKVYIYIMFSHHNMPKSRYE